MYDSAIFTHALKWKGYFALNLLFVHMERKKRDGFTVQDEDVVVSTVSSHIFSSWTRLHKRRNWGLNCVPPSEGCVGVEKLLCKPSRQIKILLDVWALLRVGINLFFVDHYIPVKLKNLEPYAFWGGHYVLCSILHVFTESLWFPIIAGWDTLGPVC